MSTDDHSHTGIRGALRKLGRIIRAMISIPVQVIAQRDVLSVIREETRRLGAAAVESATYAEVELRAVSERLDRLERELGELRQALEEREMARPPSG